MTNSRLFPLIENPQGYAFSNCLHRFQVVAAGRRSGKTERAKRKGILRALTHLRQPMGRYGFFAPVNTQAKAIWWKDLKQMIPKELMSGPPRETDLTITLLTGTELVVCGLDKPERIEGSPWDGFFIDEIDDLRNPRETWQEHLRPCLSDRRGFAIFSGVPNGLEYLFELSLRSKEKPDEWAFFTWPSSEVLPDDEIEAAKEELDPRSFRQEYEASFESPVGRPYYAYSTDNLKSPPKELLDYGYWGAGLDFNVSPYMAAVIFVHDGKTIYFIDEIKMANGNTAAMAAELRERYPNLKDIYPDPTGAARKTSNTHGLTDFRILEQAGFRINAKSRTMSIKDRINSANARFENAKGERRAFVDPKCKFINAALTRHGYKKGTSQPDEDEFVHMCDAVCYPIDYLFRFDSDRPNYGKSVY